MVTRFKKPKSQTSFQSLFFSIFFIMLLLVMIGFLVSSNLKINQKRKELKAQIEALKKEIQILEEKNQQLRTGISQAESEDYLEKIAREQLGLQKPGEKVVVITKEKEEEKKVEEKESFWNPQNWWQWIKNKLRQ